MYLIRRQFSSFAHLSLALAVGLTSAPARAQNLVENGTFDGTSASPWWGHATEDIADQRLAVGDGRLCSESELGGENTWDVIIGLSDLSLVPDQYYHIAFSVVANVDKKIRYKTGLGEAPYTDYFLRTITVGGVEQVFETTYLNLREDPAAHLQFHVGGGPGIVCIDNVVLEPVDPPVVPPYVSPSTTGFSLKDYSAFIKLGTAVDTPTFLSQATHNSILTGEFSMITPANSMKMGIIQPTQGEFDWLETDAMLAFAQQNGMDFHGHPLVWHTQAPAWLEEGDFGRDEMIQIMYDHIDALVGRYAGQIPYWDVVNEAIDDSPDYRSTIWHDRIGPEFIDLAFHRAHEADPNALLLYNDYNISVMGHPKADRVFQLVSEMVQNGVPIDMIGMQNHWFITEDGGSSGLPDVEKVRANMQRYASIGIDVQITEFDVRIAHPLTQEKLDLQAKVFADILQVCIDEPNCQHVTVWGLSDFDSWVPSTFPEYDFAHLFDASFLPKPGYHAMTQVLARYDLAGNLVPGAGAGGTAGAGGGTGAGGAVPGVGGEPATNPSSGGCSVGARAFERTPGYFGCAGLLLVVLRARRRRRAARL